MKNMYNSTGTMKVCTVLAVDIRRAVCKCTSDSGEILSEVRWVVPMGGSDGSGLSVNPVENSRVLVDVSTGYPFIIGAIPTESGKPVRRTNIGLQGRDEEDITDYSTVKMGDLIRNPGVPRDQRVGDNLFTSEGGGLLGLLASGTAILKSSPLAQIISSRFGDLVRIVSRNFEHYTDVDSTRKASIRGKIYSIRDLFRTPESYRPVLSRDPETNEIIPPETPFIERPSSVRYEGNVMWGETVGRDYADYTADTFPTSPKIVDDEFVIDKKYTIKYDISNPDAPIPYNTSIWRHSEDGSETKLIQLEPEFTTFYKNEISNTTEKTLIAIPDNTNTQTDLATEYKKEIVGPNGTTTITQREDSVVITAVGGGNSSITINSDGTILVNTSSDATMTIGGNFSADVTGTTDWTSGGAITMTAPTINLNN